MPATVQEIVTFLQAAHVSQETDWGFEERGAIALVAAPEQLKTTILMAALKRYPDVQLVSDMNTREWGNLKDDLVSKRFMTIGFLDYQKIWERKEATSLNTEGCIRAMVAEGWTGLAEKARFSMLARAFVVMCMTPSFYESREHGWVKTGFMRRVLLMHYGFDDRRLLLDAVKDGHPLRLGYEGHVEMPLGSKFRYDVTESEKDYIELALREQGVPVIPLELLLRTYNALKFHYDVVRKERDKAMQVLMNLIPMFSERGGRLAIGREAELRTIEEPVKRQRRGA